MIEAVNLVKDFGSIRAVDNVSFELKKGDILGFLGPNGAGKSTTMKMITGFLQPTSGTALVGGHDIQKEPIEAKKLFGYLPENGPLYQEMTPLEFLGFIADMRGMKNRLERDKNIQRVMEICHLGSVRHQPIETLSKGYRQRVGMAHAILHDPQCLIMDEPTDGLDPNQKQEVRRLIASMASDKAILLSTHILDEVESMCNRVIIIAEGSIIADESPEDLRRRHPRYNAVALSLDHDGDEVDPRPVRESLQRLDAVAQVIEEDGKLIAVPKNGQRIDALLFETARKENWPLTGMDRCPVRLEEVFRELTQG